MGHLGCQCPVAYGNKWIANKWVRFTEQMNRKLFIHKRFNKAVYEKGENTYCLEGGQKNSKNI